MTINRSLTGIAAGLANYTYKTSDQAKHEGKMVDLTRRQKGARYTGNVKVRST